MTTTMSKSKQIKRDFSLHFACIGNTGVKTRHRNEIVSLRVVTRPHNTLLWVHIKQTVISLIVSPRDEGLRPVQREVGSGIRPYCVVVGLMSRACGPSVWVPKWEGNGQTVYRLNDAIQGKPRGFRRTNRSKEGSAACPIVVNRLPYSTYLCTE